MDREIIEIKTPIGGATIKLKAWLTGAEKLSLSKVDREDAEASSRKAVELVVIDTDYDMIANSHGKDFDFVMEEIANIIRGSSLPPKAPASDDSTAAS